MYLVIYCFNFKSQGVWLSQMQQYKPSSSSRKSSIVKSPVVGDKWIRSWTSLLFCRDRIIAWACIVIQLPRHGIQHFRHSKIVMPDLLLNSNVLQGNVTDSLGNHNKRPWSLKINVVTNIAIGYLLTINNVVFGLCGWNTLFKHILLVKLCWTLHAH